MVAFVTVAAGHGLLIHVGLIKSPYVVTLSFFPVILAMAFELSKEVIAAATMGDELQLLRRQKALAEERAQMLVEIAPYSMIMVDDKARIMSVNRQTETSFGYGREELLGQSIEVLFPERLHNKLSAWHTEFTNSLRFI